MTCLWTVRLLGDVAHYLDGTTNNVSVVPAVRMDFLGSFRKGGKRMTRNRYYVAPCEDGWSILGVARDRSWDVIDRATGKVVANFESRAGARAGAKARSEEVASAPRTRYDLAELPDGWHRAKDDAGEPLLDWGPFWSGREEPPSVGARLSLAVNNFGWAIVTGYFVEHGFLGVKVVLDDPPEWLVKQCEREKRDPAPMLFGNEVECRPSVAPLEGGAS